MTIQRLHWARCYARDFTETHSFDLAIAVWWGYYSTRSGSNMSTVTPLLSNKAGPVRLPNLQSATRLLGFWSLQTILVILVSGPQRKPERWAEESLPYFKEKKWANSGVTKVRNWWKLNQNAYLWFFFLCSFPYITNYYNKNLVMQTRPVIQGAS